MSAVKVLVVDEFPSMRRIVKNVLAGLDVTDIDEADDGETAWPMLREGNYDLLISDWAMPGMDGISLLENIRGTRRLAELPVLLLSSAVNKEQLLEANRLKVNGLLVKPFEASVLAEKLAGLLPEQSEEGGDEQGEADSSGAGDADSSAE
jgi:two-component system chemotaxis response regulator CheY